MVAASVVRYRATGAYQTKSFVRQPAHIYLRDDVSSTRFGSLRQTMTDSPLVLHHEPVLRDELVRAVITDFDGTYVDATFGRGGHARALLAKLAPKASLIAMDRDPDAELAARDLIAQDPRVKFASARFSDLNQALEQVGVASVNAVIFDVGVSSPQLEDPERGFAFDIDGPLDMRMDNRRGETAKSWLNRAQVDDLTDVLRTYGDVRSARRFAQAIVARRPLATTYDLVESVQSAITNAKVPARLLARVFQAVRIHLNDELRELELGLEQAFAKLAPQGRLAVITFHSLEHRIARLTLREWVAPSTPRGIPVSAKQALARYVEKSVRPSYSERARNPRSRSAMLQVVERLR